MLNPSLYHRLSRFFGFVSIVNEDQPILIEDRPGADRTMRWKVSSGEQYRVDCPFCGDTRGRLYISYAWGMDSKVEYPSSKLVVCHNERCHEDPAHDMQAYLKERLSPYMSDIRKGLVNVPKPVHSATPVKQKQLPYPNEEWCIPVNELTSAQTSVKQYWQDRRFNLDVMAKAYGVTYAYEYPVNELGKDYSWLAGRVFIPVIMHGKRVGWQARVNEDNAFIKSKYFTCPGWQKGSALYNFDNARRSPLCLLTEGVTDVWRVGAGAVATFGKSLSPTQEDLIAANWGYVGVLYDPDADNDRSKSAAKALSRLEAKVPHVFRVTLPEGRDPGDCDYSFIWDCIERDASAEGLAVRRPR